MTEDWVLGIGYWILGIEYWILDIWDSSGGMEGTACIYGVELAPLEVVGGGMVGAGTHALAGLCIVWRFAGQDPVHVWRTIAAGKDGHPIAALQGRVAVGHA